MPEHDLLNNFLLVSITLSDYLRCSPGTLLTTLILELIMTLTYYIYVCEILE